VSRQGCDRTGDKFFTSWQQVGNKVAAVSRQAGSKLLTTSLQQVGNKLKKFVEVRSWFSREKGDPFFRNCLAECQWARSTNDENQVAFPGPISGFKHDG
jgi:hypothetical protein